VTKQRSLSATSSGKLRAVRKKTWTKEDANEYLAAVQRRRSEEVLDVGVDNGTKLPAEVN